MPHSQITEGEAADLLEEAEIMSRVDAGMILTTVGHHPVRGAFTLVQTLDAFELVAQYDAPVPAADVDVDLVAMAFRVLHDLGRRAGLAAVG